MLKKEIEGQLSTTAQKIVEVANSIPTAVPLIIIVTTGHGRFLGVSKRNVDVPQICKLTVGQPGEKNRYYF
jgi:hypothetical protein